MALPKLGTASIVANSSRLMPLTSEHPRDVTSELEYATEATELEQGPSSLAPDSHDREAVAFDFTFLETGEADLERLSDLVRWPCTTMHW